MQLYDGPTRRILRKTESDGQLRVDGRIDHLEDRFCYVKQQLRVTQRRNIDTFQHIADEWSLEEEKKYDEVGALVFTSKPNITDPFLLNKTIRNLSFKPDQAFNYLQIDNQAQYDLTPLLCSIHNYENITKPPVVAANFNGGISPSCYVDHSAYGRLWFGQRTTLAPPDEQVAVGTAPFVINNPNANIAGNNVLTPSVVGLSHMDERMALDQPLFSVHTRIGVDKFGDNDTARMEWEYNEQKDRYELPSFTINLRDVYVANNNVAITPHFTVPRQHTSTLRPDHPHHYIFGSAVVPARAVAVPPGAHIIYEAGVVHYDQEGKDFVYVPIGSAQSPAHNDGAGANQRLDKTFYWVVPSFAIRAGNIYSSLGRPRKYARTLERYKAATDWETSFNPQLPDVATTAHAALNNAQRPFWSFYEDTKGRRNNGPYNLWDLVEIGRIREYQHTAAALADLAGAPIAAVPGLSIQFVETTDATPSQVTDLIAQIQQLVVTTRIPGYVQTLKFIWFVGRKGANGDYFYFRLNLDEVNAYRLGPRGVAGNGPNTYTGGTGAVLYPNPPTAEINRQWALRSVKIEHDHENGGFITKKIGTPFVERLDEAMLFANFAAGEGANDPPLPHRSVRQFRQETFGAAAGLASKGDLRGDVGHEDEFTTFGAAVNDAFNAAGVHDANRFTQDHAEQWRLFLPVRQPLQNTPASFTEMNVSCVEPFFGYTTGCAQFSCLEPLSFVDQGREFPLLIQDYQYDFSRGFDKVLTNGWYRRADCELKLQAVGVPEFTTVSNKYPDVFQLDKDTEVVSEISPTFESYTLQYETDLPSFEIETREGMFEYLFIRSRYIASDWTPSTNAVITGLEITVRGSKNHFVTALSTDDIERISYSNCNNACEWRKLHDAGQGILLHLSDIGLGGELEAVYPRKNRIKLKIKVTSESVPLPELQEMYEGRENRSNPLAQKDMHLTLIRQNRVLHGDIRGLKFDLQNESYRR